MSIRKDIGKDQESSKAKKGLTFQDVMSQKMGSSANCRKPFCPAATHPNTAGHFGKPRCRVGTPPLPGCIRRSALQSIIP